MTQKQELTGEMKDQIISAAAMYHAYMKANDAFDPMNPTEKMYGDLHCWAYMLLQDQQRLGIEFVDSGTLRFWIDRWNSYRRAA